MAQNNFPVMRHRDPQTHKYDIPNAHYVQRTPKSLPDGTELRVIQGNCHSLVPLMWGYSPCFCRVVVLYSSRNIYTLCSTIQGVFLLPNSIK
jgi:hypothetical protein